MLGADIRICAPDATLAIVEARWWISPDMAGIALLRDSVFAAKRLFILAEDALVEDNFLQGSAKQQRLLSSDARRTVVASATAGRPTAAPAIGETDPFGRS